MPIALYATSTDMKLLLTSSGISTPELQERFLSLVGKPRTKIQALFIPTAADPEPVKDFVLQARTELCEVCTSVSDVDLKECIGINWETLLKEIDVVFVNGGNAFYLLYWIRKSGFEAAVKDFLSRGGVYVGVSAGSIVASPSIDVANWKGYDDPKVVELPSLTAFGLVPFHIFVHYSDRWEALVRENRSSLKEELKILKDGEAIVVEASSPPAATY